MLFFNIKFFDNVLTTYMYMYMYMYFLLSLLGMSIE